MNIKAGDLVRVKRDIYRTTPANLIPAHFGADLSWHSESGHTIYAKIGESGIVEQVFQSGNVGMPTRYRWHVKVRIGTELKTLRLSSVEICRRANNLTQTKDNMTQERILELLSHAILMKVEKEKKRNKKADSEKLAQQIIDQILVSSEAFNSHCHSFDVTEVIGLANDELARRTIMKTSEPD